MCESLRPIDRVTFPPHNDNSFIAHARIHEWNIFPLFVAYKNPKDDHKNAQKGPKNFKPSIHNVVSTGTNFAKNEAFYVLCWVRKVLW